MIHESDTTLTELSEASSKVRQTLQTPGWQDVIAPALKQRREDLCRQLLDETEHRNMILIQQGTRAIDNLLLFIEDTLASGEQAVSEIRRRMETEYPERRDSEPGKD